MLRLRQVALVAAELDPAVDEICRTLDVEVCFNDPGVGVFGLHNALMAIGDTFLEVVSPDREGTTAGRYLQHRGGDGGYMAIFQVDDMESTRRRVRELGIRTVWQSDEADMKGTHLHPRDVPGAIVSLDWADPPSHWKWAGPDWRSHVRTDVAGAIVGCEIQSERPAELAATWGQVLDRPVGEDGSITYDDGTLRFVPIGDSRPEGISAFAVRVTDRARAGETHRVCGTRFDFV
jgi:Glyoxalase-like domain